MPDNPVYHRRLDCARTLTPRHRGCAAPLPARCTAGAGTSSGPQLRAPADEPLCRGRGGSAVSLRRSLVVRARVAGRWDRQGGVRDGHRRCVRRDRPRRGHALRRRRMGADAPGHDAEGSCDRGHAASRGRRWDRDRKQRFLDRDPLHGSLSVWQGAATTKSCHYYSSSKIARSSNRKPLSFVSVILAPSWTQSRSAEPRGARGLRRDGPQHGQRGRRIDR